MKPVTPVIAAVAAFGICNQELSEVREKRQYWHTHTENIPIGEADASEPTVPMITSTSVLWSSHAGENRRASGHFGQFHLPEFPVMIVRDTDAHLVK